jgi:hypothetical protein
MSYNSPRGGGLAPGLTAFEEDVESLLPLETEASTSSRETNSRDVLLRENLSLQKLSSSSQKDRLLPTFRPKNDQRVPFAAFDYASKS